MPASFTTVGTRAEGLGYHTSELLDLPQVGLTSLTLRAESERY